MLDYITCCAETLYPIKLKVSKEEAEDAVKEFFEVNASGFFFTEQENNALCIDFSADDMVHISSALSGPVRIHALDDLVQPFLERCADPDTDWFIKQSEVLGTEIKEWLIVFHDGKEMESVSADTAFDLICQQIKSGELNVDKNRILKKGDKNA